MTSNATSSEVQSVDLDEDVEIEKIDLPASHDLAKNRVNVC